MRSKPDLCNKAHWNTQTFIAGLHHGKIDATGIISGPMDKEMFDLCVEGILAPMLRPGDVVILDNLPAHRSTVAAKILKKIGARFLFLPEYSPDLNPIEMAFSKLKALSTRSRQGHMMSSGGLLETFAASSHRTNATTSLRRRVWSQLR